MDAVEAVTEHCEKLFNVMSSNPEESHTDVYAKLQELIDINQHVLQAIGVSHVTLDKICDVTYKYGLHSKLTGAGGGGCAFTLLRPDIGDSVLCNIIEELETEGFSCFATEVGSVGVMLHDSLPEYLT